MGLDHKGTKDFLAYLDQARVKGAGVLMCTHILDTAEKICSSFVLMDAGTVVARGTLLEIREQCQLPVGSLADCFDKILEHN